MNEFETRINALRLQYKAERLQIQKDCDTRLGHINNDLGRVATIEAREGLWAEKRRIYEATRQSMAYNRLCYRQQLELLQEEQKAYRRENPSRRDARRAMKLLHRYAESRGVSLLSFPIDSSRHGEVSFC